MTKLTPEQIAMIRDDEEAKRAIEWASDISEEIIGEVLKYLNIDRNNLVSHTLLCLRSSVRQVLEDHFDKPKD